MCGIAGAWFPGAGGQGTLIALGHRLGDAIAHRGPDDFGAWADAAAGLVLSHRRLSIVDLSPEGHQPMVSADQRWVIAFNGEIYDHGAIRAELAALGHRFRGHSDTDVLLAAIAQWGVEAALERGNGMLAFAAWDRKERVLWLARDRLGKKPLYYGRAGDGSFVFGSELAALRAFPSFRALVDPDALALLLRFDYIPAPYSILRGVHKLPAGHLLRLDAKAQAQGELPAPTAWWSALETQRAAILQGFDGSEDDALDQLDALLRDATALRMEADVPLGSFLSGGTDSSLVTALMQAQSKAHRPPPSPPTWAPRTRRCTWTAAPRSTWCRSCRACSTNPSPTPRRSRPPCCAGSRASTSPSRCRATAATNSSSATAATRAR
jgi:asparagine synthase (glutamine-hydrolysing)